MFSLRLSMGIWGRKDKVRNKVGPRALILKFLPTFCWQTISEIVLFLEKLNPDIDESSVRSVVYNLKKEGKVEARRVAAQIYERDHLNKIQNRYPLEYRRTES